MKYQLSIFLIILLSINYACTGRSGKSVASSGGEQDSTIISFVTEIHDFGTINSGESVDCSFEFSNKGKKPLLIQEVIAGCGCTNVKFPKKPLAPNQKGTIEVTFNSAGRQGYQHKSIKVISNGSEKPVILTFQVNVQQ
ncbi:MAG: DUF1573 domain-containing protein [Marinilabiliaceae bacterium]|nr:DUF1573 domain-containing protein [Marinilabiliaceae bacterium]